MDDEDLPDNGRDLREVLPIAQPSRKREVSDANAEMNSARISVAHPSEILLRRHGAPQDGSPSRRSGARVSASRWRTRPKTSRAPPYRTDRSELIPDGAVGKRRRQRKPQLPLPRRRGKSPHRSFSFTYPLWNPCAFLCPVVLEPCTWHWNIGGARRSSDIPRAGRLAPRAVARRRKVARPTRYRGPGTQ